MANRISLYYHTLRYMKPSQTLRRVGKKLGLRCRLGVMPAPLPDGVQPIAAALILDADPELEARFPVEMTMEDRVCFLQISHPFLWNTHWFFPEESPLWNYNLQYCEFLLPLAMQWKKTGEARYLHKLWQILEGWICANPKEKGGTGWDSYPIALRLTVWLSVYTLCGDAFAPELQKKLVSSMYDQYCHLAAHLEKDLLGNHYFEDLKALCLGAVFFRDEKLLEAALKAFQSQCKAQILPDGMHFELSPMYHKLMLEAVLRVALATGREEPFFRELLQRMADCAYSLEAGLQRLPLFNDCGSNTAKGLAALLEGLKASFDITPVFCPYLEHSGYYIFRRGDWQLVVDAGQPGPDYIPGHAHCDAGSFELFYRGQPVLINCGTYAYQCKERPFFRSTAAHNTVQVAGVEQSQCWSVFRLAKRAKVSVGNVSESGLTVEILDQNGNTITRRFSLTETALTVSDRESSGKHLLGYLHFAPEQRIHNAQTVSVNAQGCSCTLMPYAPEYGAMTDAQTLTYHGDALVLTVPLGTRE